MPEELSSHQVVENLRNIALVNMFDRPSSAGGESKE